MRRAQPGDAPILAGFEALGAHTPWSERSLRDHLELHTTLGFMHEAGHILTSVVVDEAEVLTVVVLPSERRRGHGAALLRRVERAWSEAGVTRAFLEVRVSNAGAIALYERHGWVRCGTRPRYYADGEDAALYDKRISSDGS